MYEPIPERVAALDTIGVVQGNGRLGPDGVPERACAVELAAWVSGCGFTDSPPCTDPSLAALLRVTNDNMPSDEVADWARAVAPLAAGVLDASALLDRLAIERLDDVLTLAPTWPEAVRSEVVQAIKQVQEALRTGDDLAAAREAARSREAGRILAALRA